MHNGQAIQGVDQKPIDGKGRRFAITTHAATRMSARRISRKALDAALRYGRVVHTRGAVIYAIGRREVSRYGHRGINLQGYDGIQVVCHAGGVVMTAYRNRNFRALRRRLGRRRPAILDGQLVVGQSLSEVE